MQILQVIEEAGGELSGLEIARRLSSARGTVYAHLFRMERAGLVQSSNPIEVDRLNFKVTQAGRLVLAADREAMARAVKP